MERYSRHVTNEAAPEEPHRPNIEKVTGWLVGLQARERSGGAERRASPESSELKTERDMDRRQEVRDEPRAVAQSGMVAVGEVLTDRSSSSPLPGLGASGVHRVSRQKKMAREERKATHAPQAPPSGLTTTQAVQLGIVVGVCAGLLLLLWLSVR